MELAGGRDFAESFDSQHSGFLERGYPFFGHAESCVSFCFVATLYFFGTHLREEKHFLNCGLAGHEHHETVHADAHA